MSNALATTTAAPAPVRRSVLFDMASRFGMEPEAFEITVRQTCMPTVRGAAVQATREEFAAFLLVAKNYDLNPLTKEIYAFPRKGGGIVPIVGVDGWFQLVNRHPEFDGVSFEFDVQDGMPHSCTATFYRKDRTRPIVVTEYLKECKRDTDMWRDMPVRMLRHKAYIQGARMAFGFSGIHDEDEGAIIAGIEPGGAPAMTPPAAPRRQRSQPRQIEQAPAQQSEVSGNASGGAPAPAGGNAASTVYGAGGTGAAPRLSESEKERFIDADHGSSGDADAGDGAVLGDSPAGGASDDDGVTETVESLATEIDERLGYARTSVEVEEAYADCEAEERMERFPGGVEQARDLKEKHLARVEPRADTPAAAPADDFPGNDAIVETKPAPVADSAPAADDGELRRRRRAPAPKDPFEIPATFKGGGHYQTWVRGFCEAAKDGEDEQVVQAWKNSSGQRGALLQSEQLASADVAGLKALVEETLDRVAPVEDGEADGSAEDTVAGATSAPGGGERAPTGPEAIDAYQQKLDQAVADVRTRQEMEDFWTNTQAERDQCGASEMQVHRWKTLKQRTVSDLPAAV